MPKAPQDKIYVEPERRISGVIYITLLAMLYNITHLANITESSIAHKRI